VIALLFGAARGLVWNWIRQRRNRRELRLHSVLENLYELAAQHHDPRYPHSIEVLRAMNLKRGGVQHSLEVLAAGGLVQQVAPDMWSLTEAGIEQAEAKDEG
jgi:hypothetical protein